jgi:multicomponent Na+:H+ antiporter subunit E
MGKVCPGAGGGAYGEKGLRSGFKSWLRGHFSPQWIERGRKMSFFLTFIIMFAFWILLSGHFTVILVISGLVASLIVAWFSHDLLFGRTDFGRAFRWYFRFLRYLPWLLWQIIVSNLDLVYRTLHPKMPIDPRMVEFDTNLKTDLGIATLANSITLTPGTVTIAADKDGRFKVHAIAQGPAESLLEGDMKRRVERLEEF